MTFNSVFFILIFLPIVLIGYHALARTPLRLPWLIAAGLVFYGRSQAYYVPLLLGSALFNYGVALGIEASRARPVRKKLLTTVGVVIDAGALLYLKYFSAVFNTLMMAAGRHDPLLHILTPLAISFYTFQQIGFLVDVANGRTIPGRLVHYLAYISFFPQLLAGPISLHQEIAPQMQEPLPRGRVAQNILIGLVIFALGLFKKTVVADTMALWADPIFDGAALGGHPGLFASWGGAALYTLQIYFDFSGYSDMAIGTARMFGILLPLNFFSPFRSKSIANLWQRWHMTLGRFVRTYIFQPLAVPLTRFAADRGYGRWTGHSVTTLLPTFLSMLIIGTWHGPNWTFVLFGAMHGTFMCVNEIYNFATRRRRRGKPDPRAMVALYGGLTVFAFMLAEVPFRSNDVPTAMRVFAGMIGLNGTGFADAVTLTRDGAIVAAMIAAGGLVCFLLPNTEQIMTRVTPALEWDRWSRVDPARIPLVWRLSSGWLAYGSVALFLGLVFVTRGTQKFIYFNF